MQVILCCLFTWLRLSGILAVLYCVYVCLYVCVHVDTFCVYALLALLHCISHLVSCVYSVSLR